MLRIRSMVEPHNQHEARELPAYYTKPPTLDLLSVVSDLDLDDNCPLEAWAVQTIVSAITIGSLGTFRASGLG